MVVKIGRNTAPSKFAVLDQYLAWNGKEGHWSGMVSPVVLTVFKAMFEPKRLIVSNPADELAGEEPSNTSTDVFDNLASTVQHLEPPAINAVESTVPMVYERLAMASVRNFTTFGPYRPVALQNHRLAKKFFGQTRGTAPDGGGTPPATPNNASV